MKHTRIGAFGLVLALLLAACAPAQQPAAVAPTKPTEAKPTAAAPAKPADKPSAGKPTGGTFTFGVLLPLTGPAAGIGTINRQGLDMAIEEINSQGGAGGMLLEANVQDHKGNAQAGTQAMNQLVNIAQVPYVISTFSGPTLASQPIAAQNKVLLVNSGGTDVSLLNKPWLYNNQVMAHNLVPPLAKYASEQGYRRAALITSNDAYGDGSRKAFREAWQKLGGELVADELFALDSTDLGPQLTKIKVASPQFVMAVAVGQTQGLLVKQARALGIDAPFIGPLATNDLIQAGAEATEGFVDSGIAVDPETQDAAAKRFIETYRQKYGVNPDWPSGTMYESVYLLKDLIDAVAKEGGNPKSGEALLKAIERKPELHNYLAGGTVRFEADHSVLRKLSLRKVQGGKFQPFKLVDAGP